MNRLNIAIIGIGYVGATCAACIAELGHNIKVYDKIKSKAQDLVNGEISIKEPNLHDFLLKNSENIQLATNISDLYDCDLFFLCVDTPFNGKKLDISSIKDVIKKLADNLGAAIKSKEIVIRSTVQPGLLKTLRAEIPNFDTYPVFLNPEFLREGSAIADFFDPPKIVIGENKIKSNFLKILYKNFKVKSVYVDFSIVEYTKLIDNSWHAVKVAFANEIGRILQSDDINVDIAISIFLSDTKLNISDKYLKPGNAFGGSCLTKDLQALASIGSTLGLGTQLLENTYVSNENQVKLTALSIAAKVEDYNVILCNVAFKLGTNDLRESHVLKIGKHLRSLGKEVFYCDEHLTIRTIGKYQMVVGDKLDEYFSQSFRRLSDISSINNAKIVWFDSTGYKIFNEISGVFGR